GKARDRCGVDDRAAPARQHHVDRALRGVPVRGQPDVHRLLPSFECDLADPPDGGEDRVVVQDVQLAVALDREPDHLFDLSRRADVGMKKFGLAARLPYVPGDAAAAFVVEIDHDDLCALARECPGRRLPDSRTGARDQRHLVLKPHLAIPPQTSAREARSITPARLWLQRWSCGPMASRDYLEGDAVDDARGRRDG